MLTPLQVQIDPDMTVEKMKAEESKISSMLIAMVGVRVRARVTKSMICYESL